MTIYTIPDLLRDTKYLPGKHGDSMKWKLEDIVAQLEIWEESPEKLSKDAGAHVGIQVLARVLLGLEAKKEM